MCQVGRSRRGGLIRLAGCGGVAGHLQQVCADRGQVVACSDPGVGLEGVEQCESGVRAAGHRDSDNVVERYHRVVVGDVEEQLVKRGDLGPVGGVGVGSFVVDGGDRGLELVGADGAAGERGGNQLDAFVDEAGVPPCPVLLGQGDQLTVRTGPGRAVSSIRASSPAISLSSGSSRCSRRVRRIASAARSGRCRLEPAVAVYPSVNIR